MSEWISVQDNSPNASADCLVVLRGMTRSGYLGVSGRWYVYCFGGDYGLERNAEVTHWMPYPDPPK